MFRIVWQIEPFEPLKIFRVDIKLLKDRVQICYLHINLNKNGKMERKDVMKQENKTIIKDITESTKLFVSSSSLYLLVTPAESKKFMELNNGFTHARTQWLGFRIGKCNCWKKGIWLGICKNILTQQQTKTDDI